METLCEPPPHLLASLKHRYSERRRAYHTWTHVEALLKHFRAHQNLLNAPTTVLWALYWHDAIYDPASSENERNSAKLLRREANGLLPDEAIADAAAIVEATAGHHAPDGLPREKDADLKFFLDIDISIFGQTERAFDAYEAAIREEYSFVPLGIYKSGRAAILKGFLDREQLYFTGVFKDQWEEQARKNLRRSIRRLEAIQ